MSRLIRLYPGAWRDRYGEEMLDTLGSRPLRTRDRLDLIRGAIDAHLHPGLLGARIPVLVGPGGSMTATSRFPVTVFLSITAALAFLAVAVGMLVQDVWTAAPYWGASSLLGTMALGALLWRAAPTTDRAMRWAVRAGATAMLVCLPLVLIVAVAGLARGHGRLTDLIRVVAGWSDPWLTTSLLLVTGSLMIASVALAVALIRRHRPRAFEAALLALPLALLVSIRADAIRVTCLVFAAYALLALGLGIPGILDGRRLALGVGGGILAVGLLSLAFAMTSPWTTHDGYSLRCAVGAGDCVRVADQTTSQVHAEGPGRTITHLDIASNGMVGVCWTGATEADNGCWWHGAW